MIRLGSLFLVAATAAAVSLLAAPALAEQPDLSGNWELNKDLSDDPREKMREAMQSRGGGRGSGGSMGGGRGGGMGRGGGDMGGGRGGGMGRGGGDMGSRGGMIGRGAESLTITQADPELTIHFADGRQRWLNTDGSKQKRETERGQAEVQAKWNGDKLVITTTTERSKTTESWELKPGSNQLLVTTKMDGRMSMSFKRVYDAAKDDDDGQPADGSTDD